MAFPITREEHDAIDARIKALPELVVAAAVLTPFGIITRERPARHGDLWGLLPRGMKSDDPDCTHGFLTSRGRFVDRLTAGNLVLETGQGSPRGKPTMHDNFLFSEDLWLDLFELNAGGVGQAEADGQGSADNHEQASDAANGPTQIPPQGTTPVLSDRVAELEAALGNISRMRVFPDNQINVTTLSAAIRIARALTGGV